MPSRFDDELWQLVPDAHHDRPAHLVEFVRSLAQVRRALDLGCGDGRLTRHLRAERVVAADVSAVALERAARRVPDAERVVLEPDAPLPFADGEFELVVCTDVLEHVRDVQLLLSEARRVLAPGGTLGLATPAHTRLTGLRVIALGFERVFPPLSPHLHFFSRRSLAALLADMGFSAELRRRRGTLLAVAGR